MKTTSILSLTLLSVCASMCACVSATLQDTVSADETLHFNLPQQVVSAAAVAGLTCSSGAVFTTSTSSPSFDLSDVFTNLKKNGTLTVDFTTNTLSGNALGNFKHAEVYLEPSHTLLSETDFTVVDGVVNLPILPTSDTLTNLLSEGAVNVSINLSACVSSSASLSVDWHLGADVKFSSKKL